MFCKICEKELRNDAKFCSGCGRPTADADQQFLGMASSSDVSVYSEVSASSASSATNPIILSSSPGAAGFRISALGYGQLFDVGIRIYLSNFKTLVGAAAVVILPFYLLEYIIKSVFTYASSSYAGAPYFFAPLMLLLFVMPLQQGAMIWMISGIYLGERPSIRDCYRAAFAKFGKLILGVLVYFFVSFLYAVLFGILFFLTVSSENIRPPYTGSPVLNLVALLGLIAFIPVVYFYVAAMLYPYSIMLEGKGPVESIRRSMKLVKSSWSKLFSIVFLTWIMLLLVAVASQIIFMYAMRAFALASPAMLPLAGLLKNLVNLLISPLGIVFTILFYYDLRVRKEGFDLEMLANEIIR